MTLSLDVNLLLIAVFDSYHEHPVALAWFESIMNDSSVLVGLPVHSLLAFIRLATALRRTSGT
jgi:predicted nucleic acid-binding protein